MGFWVVGKGDVADPRRVVVDREALLTFVQYRSKVFEPSVAAARLGELGEAELKTPVSCILPFPV